MLSFRKSATIAVAVVLGVFQAPAEKPGGKKEKGEKVKVSGAKGGEALDLSIPKGQPQKGVNAPIYGADGKLRYNFQIGIATMMPDDVNVKLQKLRIVKFKEDGTKEFDMDLPDAVLNRTTKVLSSETKATIRRHDFEITGNRVAYNIESGEGSLGGGVKMVIFDLGSTASGKAEPTVEFEPKPAGPSTPPNNNQPK